MWRNARRATRGFRKFWALRNRFRKENDAFQGGNNGGLQGVFGDGAAAEELDDYNYNSDDDDTRHEHISTTAVTRGRSLAQQTARLVQWGRAMGCEDVTTAVRRAEEDEVWLDLTEVHLARGSARDHARFGALRRVVPADLQRTACVDDDADVADRDG